MSDSQTLKDVTENALKLSRRERQVLTGLLLEIDDAGEQTEISQAWDSEIQDRIRAVNTGEISVLGYQDVMKEAEKLMKP